MNQLTYKEIKMLLYCVRLRLNNERRRPAKIVIFEDGSKHDIQAEKMQELISLEQRLEEMQLAL